MKYIILNIKERIWNVGNSTLPYNMIHIQCMHNFSCKKNPYVSTEIPKAVLHWTFLQLSCLNATTKNLNQIYLEVWHKYNACRCESTQNLIHVCVMEIVDDKCSPSHSGTAKSRMHIHNHLTKADGTHTNFRLL